MMIKLALFAVVALVASTVADDLERTVKEDREEDMANDPKKAIRDRREEILAYEKAEREYDEKAAREYNEEYKKRIERLLDPNLNWFDTDSIVYWANIHLNPPDPTIKRLNELDNSKDCGDIYRYEGPFTIKGKPSVTLDKYAALLKTELATFCILDQLDNKVVDLKETTVKKLRQIMSEWKDWFQKKAPIRGPKSNDFKRTNAAISKELHKRGTSGCFGSKCDKASNEACGELIGKFDPDHLRLFRSNYIGRRGYEHQSIESGHIGLETILLCMNIVGFE